LVIVFIGLKEEAANGEREYCDCQGDGCGRVFEKEGFHGGCDVRLGRLRFFGFVRVQFRCPEVGATTLNSF
jgi:hypothetical protein